MIVSKDAKDPGKKLLINASVEDISDDMLEEMIITSKIVTGR